MRRFSYTSVTTSLLLLWSISLVKADWCQFKDLETCNCFYNEVINGNSIVCGNPRSESDISDSLKRLLAAKEDKEPVYFALYQSHALFNLPQDLFKGVLIDRLEMTDVDLPHLGPTSESESPLNALNDSLKKIYLVNVRYPTNWRWSKVRLEKVETFHMGGSFFPIISKDFSSAFPNIQELVVRASGVHIIEPQALAFVNKKIKNVVIERNNVLELSSESFRRKEWTADDRLDQLTELSFRQNVIKTISEDFLVGLVSLQHFDIQENNITSLSHDFFEPCAKEEWSCSLKEFYTERNPFDYETCKRLIDLHDKFINIVEIPIPYRCAVLLGIVPEESK